MILIEDPALPSVSRDTDRADMLHIFDSEMNTPWPDRLGQTVIGIILVVREILQPAADKRLRYRLGTDVHQTPLI